MLYWLKSGLCAIELLPMLMELHVIDGVSPATISVRQSVVVGASAPATHVMPALAHASKHLCPLPPATQVCCDTSAGQADSESRLEPLVLSSARVTMHCSTLASQAVCAVSFDVCGVHAL